MRKIFKAMVLTVALAIPVWAGDIGQPIAFTGDIGMPLAAPSSSEAARDGNIGQPRAVSDVLVSLLPSLLALF